MNKIRSDFYNKLTDLEERLMDVFLTQKKRLEELQQNSNDKLLKGVEKFTDKKWQEESVQL